MLTEEIIDEEDLRAFLSEKENLEEGAIGRFFTRMIVRMCSERMLNNIIIKAKQKSLASLKTEEEKAAAAKRYDELLSLDKKTKKAKLIEYLKKAPEKDQAIAEARLKQEAKKVGINQEQIGRAHV